MTNNIWEWFDDEFRVYCEKNSDYRRIMTWKGTRPGSTYWLPDGSVHFDVIIPRRLHNQAASLLGMTERVRRPAKVRKARPQLVATQ